MSDRRVLGKKLYDREQVVNRIARSKLVQEEIDKESKSKKSSRTSLETRARRYARTGRRPNLFHGENFRNCSRQNLE